MTFVGKILVILIMAFSLVFLGVSTVVFTTATNWKDQERDKQNQGESPRLNDPAQRRQGKVTAADGQLKAAKDEHKKVQLDERENRLADLEKQKSRTPKTR